MTILMIILSSFIPFVVFAQANFVRDLFIGITGSDVLDLQKVLNSDSETKITESGAGSVGAETYYFGNLTKLAVEKFQLKYSDYILKPIGLALPTGRVGQYTRDFLNNKFIELKETAQKNIKPVVEKIISKTEEVKKTNETENKNLNTRDLTSSQFMKTADLFKKGASNSGFLLKDFIKNDDRKIMLYAASKNEFAPESEITFHGAGFTESGNTFSLGDKKIENINCESYIQCTFKLPKDISLSKKNVSVQNSSGSSNHQQFKVEINITKDPVAPPKITQITPEKISYKNLDTKIIIKGENLAEENYVSIFTNNIKTTKNNNSVEFKMVKSKDLQKVFDAYIKENADSVDFPVLLQNKYGYSNHGIITIDLKN
jgi:hypothetical protein